MTRLLLLLFLVNFCYSQQEEFIYGKIQDVHSGEPVVFATVSVKGKAIGVISNMDGGFKIPIAFKTHGDFIEVTSMGYEKLEIELSSLSRVDVNIVSLEPKVFSLEETVVSAKRKKRLSARKIVKNAIEAIPVNFSIAPFSTVGYYRDYQLKGDAYINLNEAILEVFDKGFGTRDYKNTKALIYQYKKNVDFDRNTVASGPYDYIGSTKVIDKAFLSDFGGNEFAILRIHDAIRNYEQETYSFVYRLASDLLRNHSFSKEQDTFLNNEPIYVISMKAIYSDHVANGKLFIAKKNFAIHKIEYSLYSRWNHELEDVSDREDDVRKLIFEVITEYRRQQGKMYLNYISFNNVFRLQDEPRFIVESFEPDIVNQCFVVHFNNFPTKEDALAMKRYHLWYKGRELGMQNIRLAGKRVYLFPELTVSESGKMFSEIEEAMNDRGNSKRMVSFSVEGIKDVNGNVINRGDGREYYQFREFFVQKVIPGKKEFSSDLFMDFDRPLFDDQSIYKTNDLKDYWMNTPLKNLEE